MKFKSLSNAIFFIAICAHFNWATAENIYKCGATYRQTPCAEGTVLNVDDSRDAGQKAQADQATQRDAKLADSLEKERLEQEKKASAAQVFRANPTKVPQTSHKPTHAAEPLTKITPKRIRSPYKKPDAFIAEIPGSEKKPAKKTSARKKKAANPV
jgi:uncharacterized phage protein gp47/JayE